MNVKFLPLLGLLLLTASVLQAQDLKKGILLHQDDIVEEGYLFFNERYKHYLYFTLEEGKEPVMVYANEIQGFVVEQDTFEVLKNFFVRDGFLKAHYPIGFAQVLVDGKVSLYYHKHVSSESQTKGVNRVITEMVIESFLLKKEADEEVVLVRSSNKRFKEVLSVYFKDCDALSQAILADKYTYNDIQTIVKTYNDSQKP